MKQIITWRDMKAIVNGMTEEQLNFSMAIEVAQDGQDGDVWGLADDGSLPRLFIGTDCPALDEDEPFLRLEI